MLKAEIAGDFPFVTFPLWGPRAQGRPQNAWPSALWGWKTGSLTQGKLSKGQAGEAKGWGEDGDQWTVRTSSRKRDWGLAEEGAAQDAGREGGRAAVPSGPRGQVTG